MDLGLSGKQIVISAGAGDTGRVKAERLPGEGAPDVILTQRNDLTGEANG
ncbi:hypothetical protein [Acidisoma sp.]